MKAYFETENGILYHADCQHILPEISEIDMVLTDPPYGIDYQCTFKEKTRRLPKIANDKDSDLSFLKNVMERLFYSANENVHAYIFCRWDKWPIPVNPWKLKNMLVWDKISHGTGDLQSSYAPQHELIAYAVKGKRGFNGKRNSDIVHQTRISCISNRTLHHSCQKPVGLMMYFIEKSSNKGDMVIDPFLGSGTTAIACELTQRKWNGIEISEQYCEIAAMRIEKEIKQLKLF